MGNFWKHDADRFIAHVTSIWQHIFLLLQFGDTFFSLLQFAPKTRVHIRYLGTWGFSIFAIKKSCVLLPKCYKIKREALNSPPSLNFFCLACILMMGLSHLLVANSGDFGCSRIRAKSLQSLKQHHGPLQCYW